MKNKKFYTSLVVQLFLGTALVAAPGAPAGGGGGRSVGPVTPVGPIHSPVAPTPAGTPGTHPSQPPTTGIQNPGDQIQAAPTNSFTALSNNITTPTNTFSGTNAFAGISNNPAAATTAANPMTNAIIGTNTTINGNVVSGDQTVTASDRILLTTLSQGVRATLGVAPNANLPVHFMINNGTVTLLGTVQNPAQSQSLLSQVQQTPGVLNVVNGLRLASPMMSLQNPGMFGAQSDHAFSPRDQTLLTTVQQQAAMQLGINNSSQMPVHFSIQNGVVGVTGQVSSFQEKQALLSAIAKTPGITRVVDNVGVLSGAAGMNNALPATSRSSGSNPIFLNTNQASGF